MLLSVSGKEEEEEEEEDSSVCGAAAVCLKCFRVISGRRVCA